MVLFDVHFLQPNVFSPQTDVKMPKVTEKSHKTTYPPGCKELHEGLSTDELLKRLKVRVPDGVFRFSFVVLGLYRSSIKNLFILYYLKKHSFHESGSNCCEMQFKYTHHH